VRFSLESGDSIHAQRPEAAERRAKDNLAHHPGGEECAQRLEGVPELPEEVRGWLVILL